MLTDVVPEFLYPNSVQFPFDQVCEQIVSELEKRNWLVPGIEVTLRTYGTGRQKYKMVSTIKGADFKLWFCRVQGSLPGGKNNIAAITEIIIPKHEIHVHEDESGPSYTVYVGKNWEADKEWFLSSSKIHARLNHEPRRYLCYTGRHRLPTPGLTWDWIDLTTHPKYLYFTDDLGRQYSPRRREPKYYETNVVFQQFADWLQTNLLARILEIPEQAPLPVSHHDPKPFPKQLFPSMYTFVTDEDMHRITLGKANINLLLPFQQYALQGGGLRVVPYGTANDGTVPEIAYDGFLWCKPGRVTPQMLVIPPEKIGREYRNSKTGIAVIRPTSADDIYVIDVAPQAAYKAELARQFPLMNHLTEEQYAEYMRIGGRTIVPLASYVGGYKKPILLIARELDFDEIVRVIALPHL